MSVDIFGDCEGYKGKAGPRGRAGKDGLDIAKWIPDFILSQFQKTERCCFIITDPGKDLEKKDENYIKWITRSRIKYNAEAVRASKSIKLIKKGHWGLNFNNSLYRIYKPLYSHWSGGYIFTCVTFQLVADKEQFIFNDYAVHHQEVEGMRGVSATRNNIIIWGVDNDSNYISIPYHNKKDSWTTMLVEWLPDKGQGIYIINNKEKGVFTSNKRPVFLSDVVYMGGKVDNEKLLSGAISAFEVYESVERTPDNIKDLIIRGQLV